MHELLTGAGLARATPHGLFGALDRIERAEAPDDDLVRALVERPAAGLTLRHRRIVRARLEPVVSHSFSRRRTFG